jgi:hypothetical protein
MKIYLICFDNKEIAYPKVFTDKALAEERLTAMQDEMDADADKHQCKSYSHWYSVEEMEVEE